MSKIAIYNLYWNTFGGGEVLSGALAEHLSRTNEVTLLGPEAPDEEAFNERLDIDLAGCRFAQVFDDHEAAEASAAFDLFINHTWMSRAAGHATDNVYVVMFPGNPRRLRNLAKSGVCHLGYRMAATGSRVTNRFDPFARAFEQRIYSVDWLESYGQLVAISDYTATWIKRLWNRPSDVLYPPVGRSPAPSSKTRTILSVGRFFPDSLGHCKRQLELVEAFRRLLETGVADGWRLVLAGGCNPTGREYLLQVRRAAVGLPIDVRFNVPGAELEALYGEAAIYWHAAGFGQSARRFPMRFEHFGISVVEAMAAGAVPLVLGAGGPADTVRDLVEGRHWQSLDDLVARTVELVEQPLRLARLSRNSIGRSKDFERSSFGVSVDRVFDRPLLEDSA